MRRLQTLKQSGEAAASDVGDTALVPVVRPKALVHQTDICDFKLENVKNQVQIARGKDDFGPIVLYTVELMAWKDAMCGFKHPLRFSSSPCTHSTNLILLARK